MTLLTNEDVSRFKTLDQFTVPILVCSTISGVPQGSWDDQAPEQIHRYGISRE